MLRCLKSLVVLSLLGLLIASPALARELTYSNFFPPTHVQSKVAEAWCQEVAKRTGGEVTFAYFPGQSLTKAPQSYDAVVTGICDVAMSCLAYTRGRFPVMEVVDLPLGYTDGKEATKVANRVYQVMKPKSLDEVKVMYLHAHGPGLLHTKDKKVATLEDMKGLKIRAHGTIADMVKALGAAPVTMPMPEVYQALQKGVVDGAFYPVESNQGWKLGEVCKYCTETYPVGYTTTFFVVMNKDVWNGLSPKAQKAIQEINAEWAMRHAQAWDESDAKGREFFLSQKGREYVKLTPEQGEKWIQAVKPVIDAFIKKLTDKGLDGKAALAAARQAQADSRKKQ